MKVIVFNDAKQIQFLHQDDQSLFKLRTHFEEFQFTWKSFLFAMQRVSRKVQEITAEFGFFWRVSLREKGRKIEDTRQSGVYIYISCRPASVRLWLYCWSSNNENWNQIQVEKNVQKLLRLSKGKAENWKNQSWQHSAWVDKCAKEATG